MIDTPWAGDACSLVDAFRRRERSPLEEVEATLAAIERSDLNAFSFVDPERAVERARNADPTLAFGGVPVGIKELEAVEGWPQTEASLVYRDRVATRSSAIVERLVHAGGANPVGLTTASEFGGLNVSVTRLNGITRNPHRLDRTVGGSSGGSAAAVAGGLVSLATGGDGGGSIRIPAGYTGLVGFKGTYGRIPRNPHAYFAPGTVVLGSLTRSVRDIARFYDVAAGTHPEDPSTIPTPGAWEAGLGSHDLAGLRVAVVPALAGAILEPGVAERIELAADALIATTRMQRVDIEITTPNLAALWSIGNLATLLADLGDRWPRCEGELTHEVALGLRMAEAFDGLHTRAAAERLRVETYEAMAKAFDRVDLVIAATNPGPAFAADSPTSSPSVGVLDASRTSRVGWAAIRSLLVLTRLLGAAAPSAPARILRTAATRMPALTSMGAGTIVSNVYGNPAVSIPAARLGGLPLGVQVLTRHHADALLLDVALRSEREVEQVG